MATATTPSPHGRSAQRHPGQHYSGSFMKPQPQHIVFSPDGVDARVRTSGDAGVSIVLILVVGFVIFTASFFWRKCRNIHSLRNAYEYSQLSQFEREAAEEQGLSVNTSTDEEELEPVCSPACPPTISVMSTYVSPHTSITNNNKSMTNNNVIDPPIIQPDVLAPDILPATTSVTLSATPLVPLQAEAVVPIERSAIRLFTDSDEELLQ